MLKPGLSIFEPRTVNYGKQTHVIYQQLRSWLSESSCLLPLFALQAFQLKLKIKHVFKMYRQDKTFSLRLLCSFEANIFPRQVRSQWDASLQLITDYFNGQFLSASMMNNWGPFGANGVDIGSDLCITVPNQTEKICPSVTPEPSASQSKCNDLRWPWAAAAGSSGWELRPSTANVLATGRVNNTHIMLWIKCVQINIENTQPWLSKLTNKLGLCTQHTEMQQKAQERAS